MEHRDSTKKTRVYLGLGSNMGDREATLTQALKLLSPEVEVVQVSSVYESEPVGYKDQPWFLNTVCCGYTALSPLRLLDYVKHIEKQLGRMLSFRNAPRPIDIDILFYGDQTMKSELLTIPHPRLTERAFVLTPLAELAPDLPHPEKRQTMAQLLAVLAEPERFRRRNWSPLYVKQLLDIAGGTIPALEGDGT
ncbi:MAG: 2-amino-4-hydroxy-6-hydroxymethyldihydropteridine diphosphokinase [Dehalococcoidia bacterium]